MIRFLIRSAAASAVLAGATKAWSCWSPAIFADVVIRVVNGVVQCQKGSISSAALRAVERALSDVGVTDAKITVTRAGTFRFSPSIQRQSTRGCATSC
jgi:hypothetical protein